MASLLRWYQLQLSRRPILTQSVTTAFLFGAGDVLSQQAVERVGWSSHDPRRTLRMSAYGGLIFGPAATLWFRFLGKNVSIPSSPTGTVFARVACDQFIFAPTNLVVFLSTMAVLEGKSAKQRLQDKYTTILKTNFKVWPLVQVVNFRFVPEVHRVLVVNVVALGWNCYLSFLNSQGGGSQAAGAVEKTKEKVKELK